MEDSAEKKKGTCVPFFLKGCSMIVMLQTVLEREKSLELSTYTLARYRSTN